MMIMPTSSSDKAFSQEMTTSLLSFKCHIWTVLFSRSATFSAECLSAHPLVISSALEPSLLVFLFFLRLPNGQYGPVSKMSQPKTRRCTGPFNWGGAHCAGEKVKRKIGPFLQKSQPKKNKTKRARPATATRNPPARLPGARAKKQQHNTKETSTTDPGTP